MLKIFSNQETFINPIASAMVFQVPDNYDGLASHAQMPFGFRLSDGRTYRVLFSGRNAEGQAMPFAVDYDLSANEINWASGKLIKSPVLPLGQPGFFHDRGLMPSCVVSHGSDLWLYTIGWNTSATVPYRLSIGLAISQDGGQTFQPFSNGPVLDRSTIDPCFVTTPHVLPWQNGWRMWYSSCTGWQTIEGRLEPQYRIHVADSSDGLNWQPHLTPAIDYAYEGEAIARPWVVIMPNGEYMMWFCTRGSLHYRLVGGQNYQLGWATSKDGLNWQRQSVNVPKADWCAEMQAYPSVADINGRQYLLYNGNQFGRFGFGAWPLLPE